MHEAARALSVVWSSQQVAEFMGLDPVVVKTIDGLGYAVGVGGIVAKCTGPGHSCHS